MGICCKVRVLMIKYNMWQSEEHKNGRTRLERLIAEFGLTSNVTFVGNPTEKNNPTLSESIATSATISATAVTAKRLCRLMNIMGGKAASLGLLNEVGVIKNIRSGNELYLHGIKSAYGVSLRKNLKPTTSRDGVHIPNSDTKFLTGALSV